MTRKESEQPIMLDTADVGILDAPDIRRLRQEANIIRRIGNLYDAFMDHEDRLVRLESSLIASEQKRNLSDDVLADFKKILESARQNHDETLVKADNFLKPYTELDTEGLKDLERVAAFSQLEEDGIIQSNTPILPGGEGNAGHEVLRERLSHLDTATESDLFVHVVPRWNVFRRRALIKKSAQDLQDALKELKTHGKERLAERQEAVNMLQGLSTKKLDDFQKSAGIIDSLLEVLELSKSVLEEGTPSARIKAEEALSAFRRKVARPDDKVEAEHADRVFQELKIVDKFSEHREQAEDKIKEALRAMKQRLVDIEAKGRGLSAISRLFTGSQSSPDRQKVMSDLSDRVQLQLSTLSKFYNDTEKRLTDARELISTDVEQGETPEARSLVDLILKSDVNDFFAREFFEESNRIVDTLDQLAENLRAPSPRLSHIELDAWRRGGMALGAGRIERTTEVLGAEFEYNREKAQEYGFSELKVERHEAAQRIIDAVYNRDPAYVTGTEINQTKLKADWLSNCHDLPNTPEKSSWYFQALTEHRLSNTTDNDDPNNLSNSTAPHIPKFGQDSFMLAMDFPEFDYDNITEKQAALTPQTKRILKILFNREDPTNITRDEVNTVLWSDHEHRVQSGKAKAVIQTLLPQGQNPDDYELRLMRYDEYARAAQAQSYGQKNFWTHFDGYRARDGGYRSGLFGGGRGRGGAADVDYDHRVDRYDILGVRLVLSRRNP